MEILDECQAASRQATLNEVQRDAWINDIMEPIKRFLTRGLNKTVSISITISTPNGSNGFSYDAALEYWNEAKILDDTARTRELAMILDDLHKLERRLNVSRVVIRNLESMNVFGLKCLVKDFFDFMV